MLKNIISLLRPKHYLKNGLIFLPLIFSGNLFEVNYLVTLLLAFIAFCAVASIVYIINDIRDRERDRHHPKKKYRPLASGAVSVQQAYIAVFVLAVVALAFSFWANLPVYGYVILGVYLVINILYSFGLKNVPVIDVAILAAGFVLRVLYGGEVIDIDVSRWLYLTVLAGAFYMGLGKRRGELLTNGAKSRKVNEFYTHNFLDKNMYVCLALTLVFYSLWATDPSRADTSLFWTIPVVIVVMMTYSLDVEKEGSMSDPTDVLFGNKILLALAFGYIVLTTYLLYI